MTNQTQAQNTVETSDVAAHTELAVPATVVKDKKVKPDPKSLTQEQLKAVLELRDDGYFYYVQDSRFHLKGDFAGSIRAHDGYYSLTLNGNLYSGKMLAHFYNTNEWVNFTKGARLDKDGNPIAKTPKKEKTERAPRTPPVFTPEQIEAAKAAAAAKREAAKKKAEAANEVTSEEPTETNQAVANPAIETEVETDPDF
jgi:hypothetical protein